MPLDRPITSAGPPGTAAAGPPDPRLLAAGARRRLLRLAAGKALHIGAALSMLELLAALHTDVLRGRWQARPPGDATRDRLVLSKGHGAYGLYCLLAELGVITGDIAALPGHPSDGIPGIDAATGALGHGLALGAGMALGDRMSGTDRRVAVVTGDGELDEGTNWEAAQFAAHHRLGNLLLVVDRNGLQQEGRTEEISALEPLAGKWRAFGWRVAGADGHDTAEVASAARELLDGEGPSVLIARTVKGRGVSFLEDDPAWHMGQLGPEQLRAALAETAGPPGAEAPLASRGAHPGAGHDTPATGGPA
ncbi:transketolase [Streptomyces winkii]|uniref:transketolase n=1 Tax=Streptomyces winkii TaxID=3051178 RepID=UPI0028D58750|nr:transketolase [Streptomyces sp. DSM 40971]